MDLHGIVSGYIGTVNPHVEATLKVSTGYTTDSAGRRAPTYAPDADIVAQVQPMTWKDIQMTEGLNLQGNRVAIYCEGEIDGLVRSKGKGGDLIVIAAGTPWDGTYLVAQTLETWPDWCKVAATLQNNA